MNASRPYGVNALNQYTSVGSASYTYDDNGNLTSDGTSSFAYDAENRMTSATVGGVTSTLNYDPLGRLWRLANNSSDERYVYDGSDLVAMYSGSALGANLIFGPGVDEPISAVVTGSAPTGWFHADERGSINARTDQNGNVNAIQSYDEYGIPGSSNVTRFQYTGQMYLPAIGMHYYKARMYSPTLGRFMQTDPIGYDDGPNWYAYVGNDPVNFKDPMGLKVETIEDMFNVAPIDVFGCRYGGRYPNCDRINPITLDSLNNIAEPLARTNERGGGGGGNASSQKEQPKSRLSCLGSAIWENKTGLALDTAGWIANFALPEGSAAVAIAGSVIGVTGIGAAIADNKGPADAAAAGTLAYTGKMGAAAEGMLRGAGSALGHRIGVAALAASSAYDVAKTTVDYNRCMSGN